MEITKFDITNFKGVERTTIDLSNKTPGSVITLVGLNESGKTTILEALSHFITKDEDTAQLVNTVLHDPGMQELIPKDKKAAFTGVISVRATIKLDESDIDALAKHYVEKHGLILDRDELGTQFTVDRQLEFQDSRHIETHNRWSTPIYLKTPKAKKSKKYSGDREKVEIRAIWLTGINFLETRIPKIVYFPTFLFDFPDRIYLDQDDTEINSYYVQVIQDVLDSQGSGLSVQKHILDRINRLKEKHSVVETFFAYLLGQDEKKQIDAVLQSASQEMSKTIFGSWDKILGSHEDQDKSNKPNNRRVQIEWLLDAERNNAPYLEISIVDGQTFSLSERSLGFRWFFSFLLFTEFRRNRRGVGKTIFLFDEPAANLHSKAQIKLLESFSRIAKDGTYIIYSTHSHYMINPLWLESAYIVQNRASDYDHEEPDAFAVSKTDVTATRYRTFVGSHPENFSYFQPVLDALQVPVSPLLSASRAIIVEGKYDYHSFVYLYKNKIEGPAIFPAGGAGDVGTLINLFRGWGVDFRVILDDDKAGRDGLRRYRDDYLLRDWEVKTIGDISDSLKSKSFESVYADDVRSLVLKHFGIEKISKKHFALFFQECIANDKTLDIPDTMLAFEPISKWASETFE